MLLLFIVVIFAELNLVFSYSEFELLFREERGVVSEYWGKEDFFIHLLNLLLARWGLKDDYLFVEKLLLYLKFVFFLILLLSKGSFMMNLRQVGLEG